MNSIDEIITVSSAVSHAECAFDLRGLCLFQKVNEPIINSSVFGFSEFIASFALLVIVYTISDIRYKFRVHIAPLPLMGLTYFLIAAIGTGTLLIDVWLSVGWPVPNLPLNHSVLQGALGFLFLLIALTWIFFAFVKPPVFNKWNAKKYAYKIRDAVLEGSEKELPVIAHELGRSAKNIVSISRATPSRPTTNEENKAPKKTEKPTASDYAYEILLIIGTRRLCRHIVSAAPITAMAFFEEFSANTRNKTLPVGQFVRNVSTEAILNKESLLYHEDEGFNSGWLGYVRPFSMTIYGDYDLIDVMSQDHSSPLHIHFKTAWALDSEQFKVYTRAALITLESYIIKNKNGRNRSFALNGAFEIIDHMSHDIYKIDGTKDYRPSEAYERFRVAVDFVSDAIEILNKHSAPDDRLRTYKGYQNKDIYDQIAELMFEIIFSASGVKSPRDTCWWIHYNTLWSKFRRFSDEGKAQKVIFYRLRRLLYDEICQLSECPNYKSARILAICLNVLGPVIHDHAGENMLALHKVLIPWLKKNYLALRERNPDVADACLIGSITYDEEEKRLVKSYIKGLDLEEQKEYLELNWANKQAT